MRVVVERTGLSPHVVRVWQKRYAAVEPGRSEGNRRLYSDAEIERLSLLRRLAEAGHSIGSIAKLPDAQLQAMLVARGEAKPVTPTPTGTEARYLAAATRAVRELDTHGLEAALKDAELALGAMGVVQKVAAPLAHTIGDLWEDGQISSAHEHFASAVLRTFLMRYRPFAHGSSTAPRVLVATPAGQLHEIGALLVTAVAAQVGWEVTYLGVGLPAAEIAGAARQNGARAVALSVVYPPDDPALPGELQRLRALLPAEITLLIGGAASVRYRKTVSGAGVVWPEGLTGLPAALKALRTRE